MKHLLISGIALLVSFSSYSQEKINWTEVEIYEFTNGRSYPDSLEICGGEWFVKASGNSLSELNDKEIKRIKTIVADLGCPIVFVDTKKFYTPRSGKLYILGLKKKD